MFYDYRVFCRQLTTLIYRRATTINTKSRTMNEICRKMWDRDMTVSKWSALNGFNPRYVQAVISGKRGAWGAGKAKLIFKALVNQGLMTADEAKARVK